MEGEAKRDIGGERSLLLNKARGAHVGAMGVGMGEPWRPRGKQGRKQRKEAKVSKQWNR